MADDSLAFYATPGPMTSLPSAVTTNDIPSDLDAMRRAVQGLLLHRDWAVAYGVAGDDLRLAEQHLRSTEEVLQRAIELSDAPLADARPVDEHQAGVVKLDFDPYDQPAGRFLDAAEAWTAARAGDVDPELFGIFDMWGLKFISGNVVSDFACLNKVELLPWDAWGTIPDGPLDDDTIAYVDDLAAVVRSGDVDAIRERYRSDQRLRVPATITSFQDGRAVEVELSVDE